MNSATWEEALDFGILQCFENAENLATKVTVGISCNVQRHIPEEMRSQYIAPVPY